MFLDCLRKTEQVILEIESLSKTQVAAFDMLLTGFFLDPYEATKAFRIVEIMVHSKRIDIMFVRIVGAFMMLIFDFDDPYLVHTEVFPGELSDSITYQGELLLS
jgi:hypothetical protein